MKLDGRLFAFACLLFWSLSPPLAKLGVEQVGYLNFAFLTALFTALFALPFALNERAAGVRKNWTQLLALYIFSYFLFSLLYFFGMQNVSAIQGSALLGSEVLFALLLGAAYGKERLGGRQVAFTLLLMLGISVAVMNGSFELGVGIGALFVLGSMLSLQLGFYNAPDAIRECGIGTIAFFGSVFQATATLILFQLTGAPLLFAIEPGALLPSIIYAALPGFGAIYLWYMALKRISVYMTTAIVVPAPALAVVYSALLLGEYITINHAIGISLIVLSVWKIAERDQVNRSLR